MHWPTCTIIVLALIATGCDDSANEAAKQTYVNMLAQAKSIGLDVSR